MDERVLRLLEYEKIIERLQKFPASSLGRQYIEDLSPYTDMRKVSESLDENEEALTVLRLKGQAPFGGLSDILPHLKRASIGSSLNASELLAVADTIRSARILQRFFLDMEENEEADLPLLYGKAEAIVPPARLEKAIMDCIDENGHVMDGASDKLRSLRSRRRTLESRIKDKLDAITRSSATKKFLSESIVTIRNDRYVVPVKQEYRSSLGGIVHDQSASGATLFIEPQIIVDINNQLSETRAEEQAEVERILMMLTGEVAAEEENLRPLTSRMGELDFIFARAKFAESMKATKPTLNETGEIDFKKARHPLIPAQEVVPIDVTLGEENQAIIITGPNTGGKTVTLKTIGLLTLMVQSGLHIPVEEHSAAAIFTGIYADIGDEQSIEQNLSTFSSHMTNIVDILGKVDYRSLVLFDELGAGTDPQEGAALSMAILDYVYKIGTRLVATTHYSELKAYAYEREHMINASVEFDVETLSPTYRLLLGIPGRSNALEISRRLGLSDELIEDARSYTSRDANKVDHMIESLENSRKQAEKAEAEAEHLRREAEKREREINRRLEEIENSKARILDDERKKVAREMEKARSEAEQLIDQLRAEQAQGRQIKEHELIDAKQRLNKAMDVLQDQKAPIKKPKQDRAKNGKRTFSPGEEVKVLSFNQKGHVVEKLNDSEYQVQVGIMKMKLPADDLLPVKAEKETKPFVRVKNSAEAVRTELDLRGERYDEAMNRLDKYLDEALLAGYSRVSIIHGKGTGALRTGVQKKLSSHPRVKATRFGGMGEGGSGVTIAELK